MKHPVRRSFVAGAASFLAFGSILARAEIAAPEAEIARRLLAAVPPLGERSMGDETAPVTMVEYASPTCTYSAAFNETMLPGIRRDFVETGKLRVIFREFPMDRLAVSAFMLARCVTSEKYFPTLDLMFRRQKLWRGSDAGQQLFRIMQNSGMTEAEFKSCVRNENIGRSIVEYARRAREEFGVKATPTFFIDGRMIIGQKNQAAVRLAIESALADQR